MNILSQQPRVGSKPRSWVRRRALAALGLASLLAAIFGACNSTETVCQHPNDPSDCGCLGPCQEGQFCSEGACHVSGTEAACGADKIVCDASETCEKGVCVCDEQATSADDFACGCPVVDCVNDLADHEKCIDGKCVCDPALHDSSDSSCGCPPVACEAGSYCSSGACICDPLQHLSHTENCGCQGPCADGQICQSGTCVCPSGTLKCGNECLPAGFHCCSENGDACGADTTCVSGANGYACHPNAMNPCYVLGQYVGACPSDEGCETTADGFTCAPNGVNLCFGGGGYEGFCEAGYACGPDAQCVPPGWTLCPDGSTCESGKSCQVTEAGYACHPTGATACYVGGLYTGFCNAGYACEPDGTSCIPPAWSLCGDGITECSAGKTCRLTANGYACQPDGTTGCFSNGYFKGFCDAGYTCNPKGTLCVPPGWAVCPDGALCEAGKSCQHTADGTYACHPNLLTPCYDAENLDYWGSCPSAHTCEQIAPVVLSRDNFTCVPNNAVHCYEDGLFTHSCAGGWKCTTTGCCNQSGQCN